MTATFLKETRTALGLTYLELYGKTGIHPSSLNGIEKGKMKMTQRHLVALKPFLRDACRKRAEELRKRGEELK